MEKKKLHTDGFRDKVKGREPVRIHDGLSIKEHYLPPGFLTDVSEQRVRHVPHLSGLR